MNSISRHLRNFARKPNQKLTNVPLDLVIGDTVELIDWRVKSAGVELFIDIEDGPLTVIGGPVRLQQVLVNILTNAIDAAETGTDRRIDLVARRAEERAVVTIRDRGPGIAPGLAQRIFDPFFSTKGVGKDWGLGFRFPITSSRISAASCASKTTPRAARCSPSSSGTLKPRP